MPKSRLPVVLKHWNPEEVQVFFTKTLALLGKNKYASLAHALNEVQNELFTPERRRVIKGPAHVKNVLGEVHLAQLKAAFEKMNGPMRKMGKRPVTPATKKSATKAATKKATAKKRVTKTGAKTPTKKVVLNNPVDPASTLRGASTRTAPTRQYGEAELRLPLTRAVLSEPVDVVASDATFIDQLSDQLANALVKSVRPVMVELIQKTLTKTIAQLGSDLGLVSLSETAPNPTPVLSENERLEALYGTGMDLPSEYQVPVPAVEVKPSDKVSAPVTPAIITRPGRLKTPERVRGHKVVVLGLWPRAYQAIDLAPYPLLNVVFCEEQNEALRHARKDADLIQIVMRSAHLADNVKDGFGEIHYVKSGVNKVLDVLTMLNRRELAKTDTEVQALRHPRGNEVKVITMNHLVTADRWRSLDNWKIKHEDTMVNGVALNGRWVLRDNANKLIDCSYDLYQLAKDNNIRLIAS